MLFSLLRRAAVSAGATLAAAVMFSVAASAQQTPAPAAPTYDAVFDVDGNTYSGSTTFVIDAGKVSGTMRLDSPAIVDAKLNGEVKDGVWMFGYPFTMDNQGQPCSGTVSGTAKVASDLSEVTGTVTVSGECTPDEASGTFSFKKHQK